MKPRILILGANAGVFVTPVASHLQDVISFDLMDQKESTTFLKIQEGRLKNVYDQVVCFEKADPSFKNFKKNYSVKLFFNLLNNFFSFKSGLNFVNAVKLTYVYVVNYKAKFESVLNENYDIINIHYISPLYSPSFHKVFKETNQKVVLSFWGSDLLRSTSSQVDSLKGIVDRANLITMHSEEMKDVFVQKFGMQYENKVRLVLFGVPDRRFEMIDSLDDVSFLDSIRKKYNIDKNKTIITIGHSGDPNDFHLNSIEAIQMLPNSIRSNCHLLFPMTYGVRPHYLKEIKNKLLEVDVTFTFFEEFLPLEDLAAIKLIEDILIHIPKSDALSAWMCESLYAGSFLVTGAWLPYSIFYNEELPITYIEKSQKDYIHHALLEILRDGSEIESNDRVKQRDFLLDKIATSSQVAKWKSIYTELC